MKFRMIPIDKIPFRGRLYKLPKRIWVKQEEGYGVNWDDMMVAVLDGLGCDDLGESKRVGDSGFCNWWD